ncbi:MAG: DUF1800 domain-containing protein [Acidimicrobiales bacterium]
MQSIPTSETRAWLARRAGFGFVPGEQDATTTTSVLLDRLTEPDRTGVAVAAPIFGGLPVSLRTNDLGEEGPPLLESWITHQAETPRPLEDVMTFFWHDHFAVSIAAVPSTQLLGDHLELLRRNCLGNFRTLLRAVAIDAAMLVFLNGASSKGDSPNENFGRELLELYGLGVGNYSETDVQAAAVALTGWTIERNTGEVSFAPFRHDDTPQVFLSTRGVHDLDTVIDAVVEHPSCPTFIARKVAEALLGPPVSDAVVAELADVFESNDLEIAPLVRATLEAGLDGEQRSFGRSPVHLLSSALRVTGARPAANRILALLQGAGQVPGNPPNVGGYPSGDAWFVASTVAARFSLASEVANNTADDAAVMTLVAERDWVALAAQLALPQGFEPATIDALQRHAGGLDQQPDRALLALALASPDMAVR